MFIMQIQRYFPLPDYDLKVENRVSVKISGKVIDENYTKLLINNTNLELKLAIALDKVQKKELLSQNERNILRKMKLIEGKYPNVYVTSKIASVMEQKAQYIRNRGFDNGYYKDLVINYLNEYKSASRKEIDDLLMGKLPDILTDEQKYRKISKILNEMSHKDKSIKNKSNSTKASKWILV
ncbi:Hypothetical protein CKL_3658 [Clostridium kluyveri DSM 555]|uniref:Uncharacterized protein n=2 Tax=Clostridium kluyveri TaxID=1534 RepID=A5N3F2_CLOK5|nr:Hypothetical protein CKL_3658 [Clostridium kluyveri DSM 555]